MMTTEHSTEMSFWDHVQDLRKCLIQCGSILLLIFLCLLPFAQKLYELLSAPLRAMLPENAHMIATGVTTTLMAPMMLTAYVTLLMAAPVLVLFIWNYLKSALYAREKSFLLGFCTLGLLLFYIGNAFAYFVVLPSVLHFFILISPDSVLPMTDIHSYFSFSIKLLLVFGFIFEIPVLVIALILLNIIDIKTLRAQRRFIIVGCFFIAMFITPPDALSMLMLAVPMCLLFELGLLLAALLKSEKRQLPQPEDTDLS